MSKEVKSSPISMPQGEGGALIKGPGGASLAEVAPKGGVPELASFTNPKTGERSSLAHLTPSDNQGGSQPFTLVDGDLVRVSGTPSSPGEKSAPTQLGSISDGNIKIGG